MFQTGDLAYHIDGKLVMIFSYNTRYRYYSVLKGDKLTNIIEEHLTPIEEYNETYFFESKENN